MIIDQVLIRTLLKEIRGPRSQGYINLKFNNKFNLCAKWEAGSTRITWSDFLKFCSFCNLDVVAKTKLFFHFSGELSNPVDFLNFIFSRYKIDEYSVATNISALKINRMLSGKSPLFLSDFLKLLYSESQYTCKSYLVQLTSNHGEVSAILNYSKVQEVVQLSYDYPDIAILLIILGMDEYQNITKKKLLPILLPYGIDHYRLDFFLEKLAQIEMIKIDNKQISLTKKIFADDRGDTQGTMRVREFWLARAQKSLARDHHLPLNEKDAFGSVIFATSKETKKQILSLYLDFFEQVRTAVTADQGVKDTLTVLSFQLFDPKIST